MVVLKIIILNYWWALRGGVQGVWTPAIFPNWPNCALNTHRSVERNNFICCCVFGKVIVHKILTWRTRTFYSILYILQWRIPVPTIFFHFFFVEPGTRSGKSVFQRWLLCKQICFIQYRFLNLSARQCLSNVFYVS